jgi:hypothetical protein
MRLALISSPPRRTLTRLLPSAEEIRNTWVKLDDLIEAALFLVTKAGDGVNGVVLPVQGKGF